MMSELPTQLQEVIDEVWDQVRPDTPDAIIEAIGVQLFTAREARERIAREGSVVRDMRGAVIPHPAIKIEADAMKIYTGLLATWLRRR